MFVLRENEQIKLQTDGRSGGVPGVLTVTNQRIVFTRRRGRLSNKIDTTLSVPLTAVTGAREEPGGAETLVVIESDETAHPGHSRAEVHVANAVHVARAITTLAKAARAATPTRPPGTGPVQVNVHLPPAPATTIVLVRCSYCRTVFPELDAKCPSCGAPF